MKLKKPYLIAEIGINHNGSIKLAKKLIDLAVKYNFDAVKFQKRNPDISTPEIQKSVIRETPWGQITYLDYKKKIEFGLKEFKEIDKYCEKKKIDWFVSPWDLDSVRFMNFFKFKFNKIASAMITNIPLLEAVAKQKKKTLISTGLCQEKDIDTAIRIFKKNKCKFVIMHCVSKYPCPENELNLNLISYYKKKYKCEIGYSGHESTVSPSLLAWYLGAEYIERHITLDRSMWGTDQAASLAEDGIKTLSEVASKAPTVLGNGKKIFGDEEKKLLKKFKYW
jgi:N-acetylneuraminate synthase